MYRTVMSVFLKYSQKGLQITVKSLKTEKNSQQMTSKLIYILRP